MMNYQHINLALVYITLPDILTSMIVPYRVVTLIFFPYPIPSSSSCLLIVHMRECGSHILERISNAEPTKNM